MQNSLNRQRHNAIVRTAGALTVSAALAIAVTSCSSESADQGAELGVLVPLTGEFGAFGASWQSAVELAVEQANTAGALPDGKTITTVVADSQTSPDTAVEEVRKMASDGVFAVVGPTSGEMLAINPIAERAALPVISPAAGTIELNGIGGKYLFRTVPSDDFEGPALAKLLLDEKANNVGIFVVNEASPVSVGTRFVESFTAAGGRVASEQRVNANQSSYRAEVASMLAQNPEWIVCACGEQAGASILRELATAGYSGGRVVTGDLASESIFDIVGPEIMQGAFGETPGADPNSAAGQDFRKAYEDKTGEAPVAYAANIYDAAAVAILAMVAADSTDPAEVAAHVIDVTNEPGTVVTSLSEGIEALRNGEDIDYDGPSGPINMDQTGTAISSFEVLRAQDGGWESVRIIDAEAIADFTKK